MSFCFNQLFDSLTLLRYCTIAITFIVFLSFPVIVKLAFYSAMLPSM